MHLLCFDIGSYTQDILLLDTSQPVENAMQLVLPSPTQLVAQRIQEATAHQQSVIFTGETMGGGACTWAMRQHVAAGLQVYATPEAARTFSDDPDKVTGWGVKIVSAEEAINHKGQTIEMRDIALDMLQKSLDAYNIKFTPDVIAVAVLDHGAAPQGQSERLFRFLHLEQLLKQNASLETFIFTPPELPDFLTRMQAVVRTIGGKFPLVIMDTGPAAVYGALLDRTVGGHEYCVCINIGNAHTLAFHLNGEKVLGLFEHHTEHLTLPRVETLIEKLVAGDLTFKEVWEEGGHGSVILGKNKTPFVAVTGPQRSLFAASSRLKPYYAAPFGSMMLAGCYGLARATALKFPQRREELEAVLLR